MTSSAVTTERRGAVSIVHLDDGKANALSAPVIEAVAAALAEAESDPSVGALVLHGRPGCFCAGFDLGVMRAGDTSAISALVSDGGDLVRALYGASVPVVAACTGHALAAGALVLLGCDVRVGTDAAARIGLNEVAIGMVLPAWAMTISAERLSRRHLQLAVATARVLDPAGARDAGFLDELVPADDVLAVAVARGEELAGLDARAYAGTVRTLRAEVLARMEAQVGADRSAGSVPTA